MAKRNPNDGQPDPGDYLLSTTEVASYLAALQRQPPYSAATIRQWLESGELAGERDDSGRWSVRLSELGRWAAERGLVVDGPPPAEKSPQTNPTRQGPPAAPAKGETPAAPAAEGARFKLVPLDEEGEEEALEDFAFVDCPSCGAEVPVSSASVIVECPGCGQHMHVEDDHEESGEKGPEPKPIASPPAPSPAAPQPNPGFFGLRLGGRKR